MMGNYKVYLGNLTIYQVSTVDSDAKRDLAVYDGVEQGEFPVAKNPDLHTWTISCELTANRVNVDGWEPAQDIFKELDKMMKSKDPDRLVMVGDCGKVSELVLVKGYSQTEKYEGVYSVKLQLTQYREASVRTQDVPYIPRPGKAPEMPVKKVFKSQGEVIMDAMARSGGGDISKADPLQTFSYQYMDDLRNIVHTNNPLCVPLNKEVTISEDVRISEEIRQNAGTLKGWSLSHLSERLGAEIDNAFNRGARDTFQAIGKAYDEYRKKIGKDIMDGYNLYKK